MITVEADGFIFHFENALEAFIFDEKDRTKPTFHGVPMKGVDIVAEFAEAYLYVELKDYDDPSIKDINHSSTDGDGNGRQESFKWLKNYLKYKFRDTYLFRHAEHKVEKPIHYVCLVTFDNALNTLMQKDLKRELPVGKVSKRWVEPLASSCQVVNLEKWNERFPKWPVKRSTATATGGV